MCEFINIYPNVQTFGLNALIVCSEHKPEHVCPLLYMKYP